jgi:signal transduction histidine kinase
MVDEQILIVDDDCDHLGLVERYVSAYGVESVAVTSGLEAIRFLATNPISIMVTDMVMPEMDGMQLLLHTKEHFPDIDVIIMTGYSQDYSYIDVIKAGATDFISKPFKKDEFFAKLERVFRERQTLRELTTAKEKAEASDRTKSDFIHRIGHEFKTPLTNIVGFTELMISTDIEAKNKEYRRIVQDSVERLSGIIDQLLDFSNLMEDTCDQQFSKIHLPDVLDDLFQDFSQQIKSKDMVFRHNIEESLRGRYFYGESVALKNILRNIIKNAVIFSDHGEISIEVCTKEQRSDDSLLLLFAVHDSGCGIAEDKLALIFEPFTQVEEFLTRSHDGAGLGLAICAKLIQSLHGEIWATSKEGEGSTFYFTIEMQVM